ncbi:MAG: hypothetical protein PHX00_13750, partial [Synergistaceae bacterium]|nr:hypothetical protein [Synergistaceae bacterium]
TAREASRIIAGGNPAAYAPPLHRRSVRKSVEKSRNEAQPREIIHITPNRRTAEAIRRAEWYPYSKENTTIGRKRVA